MNPGIIPRNESIPPDTMEVVGFVCSKILHEVSRVVEIRETQMRQYVLKGS